MGLIYSNIPELEGTETEISLANLAELEAELERLLEKRIAHLDELARAIARDGGDVDLIKSIILSIRSDGESDSESVAAQNRDEMQEYFSSLSLVERFALFKMLVSKNSLPAPLSIHNSADISESVRNRIAYMKNSYNDNAFVCFSELLGNAKAYYLDSTVEVCESVVSGKCQYCILPIETSRDGRLISFYEIIINYGLKICAEYDLKNSDGEEYTRYALLSGHLFGENRLKGDSFIEVTYSDENIAFSEILNAAEYFGFKLDSVESLMLSNTDEGKRFCAVFSALDANVEAFAAYLSVDCPDVELIGRYRRI